jgi:hypothetical protein
MSGDERLWAIERFVGGIDELKVVLGAEAAPAVDRAKAELLEAMAARDRGSRQDAILALARGMSELAALGDTLGAAEGGMMRAVTSQLIKGLATEDKGAVEQNLAIIQSQAGTLKKPGQE